jgi:hypothetical protein
MTAAQIRRSFLYPVRDRTRLLRLFLASPFSKTVASERDVNQMTSVGFKPLRFRQIRD